MENITKKLLLMRASLIATIILRSGLFRIDFRKKEFTDPCLDMTHEYVYEVEQSDTDFYTKIERPRASISEKLDREMMEYAQEGVRGVHLLFKNIKFIVAALAKRTDNIALILEQYYISDRINGAAIQSFLDGRCFEFSEEEKNKLSSLIETDSKRIVLA